MSIPLSKMKYFVSVLLTLLTEVAGRELEKDVFVPTKYLPNGLAFILVGLLSACLFRGIFKMLKVPVPDMLLQICLGYCWGIAARYNQDKPELCNILFLNERFFGNTFTTYVIFRIIICANIKVVLKYWRLILIITFTVVVINVFFVAVFLLFLIPFDITFIHCFHIAVLIAMTHSPETVDILMETNVSMKKCVSLLKAECMVTLLIGYITSILLDLHQDKTEYATLTKYWHFFIIGVVLSLIFGRILAFTFDLMYKNANNLVVLCLTMFCLVMGIFRNDSIPRFTPYFMTLVSATIISLYISFHRSRLKQEVDTFLVLSLNIFGHLLRAFMFFLMGASMSTLFLMEADIYDYAIVFVIYIVTAFGRILSYWLMSPLLHTVRNGLSYKEIQVLNWGGLASPICQFLITKDFGAFMYRLLIFYVTGVIFLNFLINTTTLPLILRIMGFYNITPEKEANINFCLKYVLSKRKQALTLLKMDKHLDGANYKLIREKTKLKHPYHRNVVLDYMDDSFTFGTRIILCSDCIKEFPKRLTPKEYFDIVKEARIRVLQAEKVSYARQSENGMITGKAAKILLRNVDYALQSEDKIKRVDVILKKFESEGKCGVIKRNFLVGLFSVPEEAIKPPRTFYRRMCYNIITSIAYEATYYVMSLLCVTPLIVDLLDHEVYKNHPNAVIIEIAWDVLVLIFLLVEFILKIQAYSWIFHWRFGIRQYFRFKWNIFDFIVLLFSIMDVFVMIPLSCHLKQFQDDNTRSVGYRLLLASRALRVLKLVRYCRACCSNQIKYINSKVDTNYALAYVLAKGHLTADDEILDTLDFIIDDRKIITDTKKRMEKSRKQIINKLCTLQATNPGLAATLKTKLVMTTILCSIRSQVLEIKASGAIDSNEYMKLVDVLDDRFIYVKDIKFIEPCSPRSIFNEVIWIKGEDNINEFLYDNARTRIINPGEAIIKESSYTEGIFIVISGVMKIKYEPNDDVINFYEEYGALPVIDYISATNFLRPIEDIIVAGNYVGTRGIVVGRPYNCSIVAETSCIVLFLSKKVINDAMDISSNPVSGLEARIWKAISVIFVEKLLVRSPAYQSFNSDTIKLTVQRGFTPVMHNYKTFKVNDGIEDVLLLEGVAGDFHTREMFSAPCCLPRAIHQIVFPKSSKMTFFTSVETKIMIVPATDASVQKIMSETFGTSEVVATRKYKCILHVAYSNLTTSVQKQTGLYTGRRKTKMINALDESFKDLFDTRSDFNAQSELDRVFLISDDNRKVQEESSDHIDLFRK